MAADVSTAAADSHPSFIDNLDFLCPEPEVLHLQEGTVPEPDELVRLAMKRIIEIEEELDKIHADIDNTMVKGWQEPIASFMFDLEGTDLKKQQQTEEGFNKIEDFTRHLLQSLIAAVRYASLNYINSSMVVPLPATTTYQNLATTNNDCSQVRARRRDGTVYEGV